MSGVRARPRRRLKLQTDVPVVVPRKWTENEMQALLDCIMEHGHKNFEKIQECLPSRSLENIKTFMRTVYDTACKISQGHPNIDPWIDQCGVKYSEHWRDSLQIAQVLKYLSIDGLLENHPLPESCDRIDFSLAYRFIYQALMGYPIQPVNQETLNFIQETIAELNNEVKNEKSAIECVKSFLLKNPEVDQNMKQIVKNVNIAKEVKVAEKSLKVYERKKRPTPYTDSKPPLRIVVEESKNDQTDSASLKDFSVRIEGNHSSVVNVTVPVVAPQKALDENEQQLLKSSSFNPFQIPGKWLEEPLYKNLLLKP